MAGSRPLRSAGSGPKRAKEHSTTADDIDALLDDPAGRRLDIELMRTTLTIPDDVLAAARQRAEDTGQTLGDALADLARLGLERLEDGQAPSEFWRGVKLLPRRPGQQKVTLELVNQLRDEEY